MRNIIMMLSYQVLPNDKIKENGIDQMLTEISLAPIQIRLGEGNGNSKRPTPYIATAKKCRTKLTGRGFKPESKEIGPVENTPPRLR